MGDGPSVAGIVMARDEWPLLGVSVSHALSQGVDEVWVIDHASRDGTTEGLASLDQRFPGRIHVLRLNAEDYFQEAVTTLVAHVAAVENPDWIYVFDADEFLLTGSEILGLILDSMPASVSVLTYPMENWVSRRDFDEWEVTSYLGLWNRSIVSAELDLPGEVLAAEIAAGHLNFFDVEFPAKVIVRTEAASWLTAGAHGVKASRLPDAVALDPSVLVGAHLPLLSWKRVTGKARQGAALVAAGFPPSHGWQNQMIYEMETKGRLRQFWECHSIEPGSPRIEVTEPSYAPDERLGAALKTAVEGFEDWAGRSAPLGSTSSSAVVDSMLPFGPAVRAIRAVQSVGDMWHKRIGELEAQDAELVRVGNVLRERLEVLEARGAELARELQEERALSAEAMAQRQALREEVDGLRAAVAAIVQSRSWRLTRILRDARAVAPVRRPRRGAG